jgi:hypothetical protein
MIYIYIYIYILLNNIFFKITVINIHYMWQIYKVLIDMVVYNHNIYLNSRLIGQSKKIIKLSKLGFHDKIFKI